MKEQDTRRPDNGDSRFDLPHPELDKRPWLAYMALGLAVVSALCIFLLPAPATESGLMTQLYSLMGASMISAILAWLGRRRAPMIAVVTIILSLLLLLTLLAALLGTTA